MSGNLYWGCSHFCIFFFDTHQLSERVSKRKKILRFDLEQFLSFQTAKQLKKNKVRVEKKEVNPGSLLVTFQSQWRRMYRSVGRSVVLPFYERNALLESRRNANNSSSLKFDLLVNNFFLDHVDQPIVLQWDIRMLLEGCNECYGPVSRRLKSGRAFQ
ncbi:hypothetical protein T01_16319 [Trichinella spiralis]|uniref:Uncharacterized protein n=1 Tax=Trichinella spiralis TaxID=6334 RepID=A0A0V1B1I0_TRISP|nr:hypothetical protein T01_16319 [Trichinella spiralis]